eukprot:9383612-Ditylum_brightwellii.AAC.1
MTAATNNMMLFQNQTLQAVQEAKEENAKVIQQVIEENMHQEEANTKTVIIIFTILEGIRVNQPQNSPSPSPNKKYRTACGKDDVSNGNDQVLGKVLKL